MSEKFNEQEFILLKKSLINRIKRMTEVQAGQYVKDLFAYANGEFVDLEARDALVATVLEETFEIIDWNRKKYEEKCKARSAAGKKGAEVTNTKRWKNKKTEEPDEKKSGWKYEGQRHYDEAFFEDFEKKNGKK